MKTLGMFGAFGGCYVSELLIPVLTRVEEAYLEAKEDRAFQKEFTRLLTDFAGRPTPLTHVENLSKKFGCTVLLKREDLLHGGAHKTNNVLGQGLLAKRMGASELIAETGAGQHGVATAMVGALFGIPVKIFMGSKDIERQAPNVQRMELFGATVVPVTSGSKSLKDAINEALRYWVARSEDTYYIFGTVAGPHPFPTMVADFQRVIGDESRQQCLERYGRLPRLVLACVGGGSNAIGIFRAFIEDANVQLVGVEPAGRGLDTTEHGAALNRGRPGCLHGAKSYYLQDPDGQIREAHSISAGLDYPGVGPEHAYLKETGRVRYEAITDAEAVEAFQTLSKSEGIIPALECAHALAQAEKEARRLSENDLLLVNLSGRGDKDLAHVARYLRTEHNNSVMLSSPERSEGRIKAPPFRARSPSRSDPEGSSEPMAGPSGSAGRLRMTKAPNPYAALRQKLGRPLFIPFTVLGDPDVGKSREIVETLIESGADALELGLPFSDPPADGPVIQSADTRALSAGVRISDCFGVLREARKVSGIPIGLLVYYNLILQRGVEAFYRDCAKSGVSSVLVADLPLEHASEVVTAAKEHGIAPVFLVSELTTDGRLMEILKIADGYLYVVSYLGVTGVANAVLEEQVRVLLSRVRSKTDLPLFVGFGISTSSHVAAVARAGADGVIIGSRIVREVPNTGAIARVCTELRTPLSETPNGS